MPCEKSHASSLFHEISSLTSRFITLLFSLQFVISLTYAYATETSLGLVLTLMSYGDLHYHLKEFGVRIRPIAIICGLCE